MQPGGLFRIQWCQAGRELMVWGARSTASLQAEHGVMEGAARGATFKGCQPFSGKNLRSMPLFVKNNDQESFLHILRDHSNV